MTMALETTHHTEIPHISVVSHTRKGKRLHKVFLMHVRKNQLQSLLSISFCQEESCKKHSTYRLKTRISQDHTRLLIPLSSSVVCLSSPALVSSISHASPFVFHSSPSRELAELSSFSNLPSTSSTLLLSDMKATKDLGDSALGTQQSSSLSPEGFEVLEGMVSETRGFPVSLGSSDASTGGCAPLMKSLSVIVPICSANGVLVNSVDEFESDPSGSHMTLEHPVVFSASAELGIDTHCSPLGEVGASCTDSPQGEVARALTGTGVLSSGDTTLVKDSLDSGLMVGLVQPCLGICGPPAALEHLVVLSVSAEPKFDFRISSLPGEIVEVSCTDSPQGEVAYVPTGASALPFGDNALGKEGLDLELMTRSVLGCGNQVLEASLYSAPEVVGLCESALVESSRDLYGRCSVSSPVVGLFFFL